VPGYHGDDQNPDHLAVEARHIGFPVLIKASAGGGGRGMRIVTQPAAFAGALASAQREAASAFGDDRMLLEKFVERPRHIEVQVFADRHGNIVHIFDRDCSIQRRHQKVVEEAPASGLDDKQRRAMAEAAVAAARAVGYVGAGTVEFVVPGDAPRSFYFIEMNTRLQVEHAVTEAITGLDLVEWQLRVAAGEPLPLHQKDLMPYGHAIEVRLYAEDPNREFLPQTGTLRRLRLPAPDFARVDTGVREGDLVTPYYDPMIAKIIVAAEDRAAAVGRLRRALAETGVLGLNTNLGFLARVAAHPDFASGNVDTGFIERNHAALLAQDGRSPDPALAAAALSRLNAREAATTAQAAGSADRFSPWGRTDGWRLGARAAQSITLRNGGEIRTTEAVAQNGGWLLTQGDREVDAAAEFRPDSMCDVILDGAKQRMLALDDGARTAVVIDGESWVFEEIDPLVPAAGEELGSGKLTAPMPGRVTRLLVEAGAKVRRGDPLMIVEAMKMEHTITAPADGVVSAVLFGVGELVEEGAELITLAALASDRRPG
jgi:3-methylcrotonyl-CoA carboxylase alpha subunit